MRASKKAKLTSRGWKVGDTREFLDLTPEEAALIELRLKLAEGLKARRKRKRLTQHDLAAAEPERVHRLREELQTWRRDVGAQMPTVNPAYDPNKPEHTPAQTTKKAKS